MKILVMGAGALGSVIGGFLSRHHTVTLVGRAPHMEAIRKRGLEITGIWGQHRFHPQCLTRVDPEHLPLPMDWILITTKSYDTEAALKAALTAAGPETRFVSVQNGLGNEEILARRVGAHRTFGCMAIFGAVLEAPGRVRVTVEAAPCRVGAWGGDEAGAALLARAFREAGIPCETTPNIRQEKWMKALYNLALNPLSALLQVPYGVLGELEATRQIMRTALEEAYRVAEAHGISLAEPLESYWKRFLGEQIPRTASHTSSMWMDLRLGRRTEVDHLNGAIVRLGAAKGIPTPVNQTLVSLIHALEVLHGKRSPGGRFVAEFPVAFPGQTPYNASRR